MNPSEIAAFGDSGYVVVRAAVGLPLIQGVLGAIERRCVALVSTAAEATDKALLSGFFPMWNASALWRVRELPVVRQAFEHIRQTDRLWVSLDRCGYRLPQSRRQGSLQLHWDDDETRWDFSRVQGLVALSTASRNEGGFVCAPELYRAFRDKGRIVARQLFEEGRFEVVDVGLSAGDLLVFDYRLAHGTGVHQGTRPRVVQYVSFVDCGDASERGRRIKCWETGTWRGRAPLRVYEIPDERRPPLSAAGWRALTGDGDD